MDDADAAAAAWGRATTHREKAHAERTLREQMRVKTRDLNVLLEGVSIYELQAHVQFLRSRSEYVWRLLDVEGVQIAVARKMLLTAQLMSRSSGRPLDELLKDLYLDSQREAGPRAESSAAKSWELVKETIKSIVEKELDGLHEIERREAMNEAMVEVDVLVRQLRSRIRSRMKKGLPKDWEAVSERERRKAFMSDMRELGLDPPRPGRLPNLDEVRRTHRRVSADHHPDKRKDSGAVDKFHRVNQAYQRILEYVESQKGTE